MALRLATPPASAAAVLAAAVGDLRRAGVELGGEGLTSLFSASAGLYHAQPLPIHPLAAAQLEAEGDPLAEAQTPRGWRYLLMRGDKMWLADVRTRDTSVAFNQLISGAPARRFAQACRSAEEAGLDGEARLLRVASANREALWVADAEPRFIDLEVDDAGIEDVGYLARIRAELRG